MFSLNCRANNFFSSKASGQSVVRDLENSKEAKKTLLEEIGNLRCKDQLNEEDEVASRRFSTGIKYSCTEQEQQIF